MGSLSFLYVILVDGGDVPLVSCIGREGNASLAKEEPAMHGEGCASVMGKSLHISVEGPRLHVVVSRADGQEDARLLEFHDRAVTASTLRELLPHFETLEWSKRACTGICEEIRATDGEFTVSLLYDEGDVGGEEQMIAEFNEFLSDYLAQ